MTDVETEPDSPGPSDLAEEQRDAPERQTTPFLVLQFFVFPMAIVAVCVAVFLIFGLIAGEQKNARGYLAEIRRGGGLFNVKRWQAAYAFASELEREKDLARSDPALVDEVVSLFKETEAAEGDDALVRRYLALALGRLGDRRAVPELLALVEEADGQKDPQTLVYAVWALGAIADPAAVPGLLKLAKSEDAGLRKAAVHSLGAFSTDEAQGAVAAALDDAAEDVRWNAALALAHRGDPRSARVLGEMMDRGHLATVEGLTDAQREEAMAEAVAAAGHVRGRDPALEAALERLRDRDPNLKVREAARRALDATGPDEGSGAR